MDEQNLKQKKIALATSEQAPVVLELTKDCFLKIPLVGANEFETLRNAIIIDTQQTLLLNLTQYIESIKNGSLHDNV